MEDLWIGTQGTRVCASLVTTGIVIGQRHIDRADTEAFHTWLTQWLKENPVKVEGWLNIYRRPYCHTIYPSRTGANEGAAEDRVACIPISYYVGQGLEEEDE